MEPEEEIYFTSDKVFEPYSDYRIKEGQIAEVETEDGTTVSVIFGKDLGAEFTVIVSCHCGEYSVDELLYEEAEELAKETLELIVELYEQGEELEDIMSELEELGFEEV